MVRSSTVVGHVGYHLPMAVMKSRAESDYRWERICEGEEKEKKKLTGNFVSTLKRMYESQTLM
jgi:hypothetical protein